MGWEDDVKELRDLSVGHAEKAALEASRGHQDSAALHQQLSDAAARDMDNLLDQHRGEGSS